MNTDHVENAKRFARLVYWAVAAVVIGLFVQWLAWGFLQTTPFGFIASAVSWLWLAIFFSVPVLAIVWLVRFGSLVSTASELRSTRIMMVAMVFIWIGLVVGFVILFVYAARGLFNFL
jgi:hypothetical protein